MFDTFSDLNIIPNNLYSVGGGTKNMLWSKTISDVIGINQILRKNTMGASYGDAFLSALACNDLKKEEINNWNAIESEIIAEENEVYSNAYKYFLELYNNTKDLMKKMDD